MMPAPPRLWDGVLRRLGAEVPGFAVEAWLRPLAALEDEDALRVLCPTPFHRERVRIRFLPRIAACAAAEAGRPIGIHLEVGRAPDSASGGEGCAAPDAAPSGNGPATAARPGPAGVAERLPEQTSLAYTFETFVVGPSNVLAREASLALAQGRQVGLSPLFLVGPNGFGKSHLAQAVLAETRRWGRARALCLSAEVFTTEFQDSLRSQRTGQFKRRVREECNLLIVEDVQFFRGKIATQLELFHTLQHLRAAGGRVVLTGDRLPREIPDLDGRLVSHMTSGLVAELEPPDAALRRAILRSKAAGGGVGLPDECLDRLVDTLRGSVRDLEGVLIQLVATATLLNRRIDLELTEMALRKVAPEAAKPPRLEPQAVVEVVAAFFRTTPAALGSRSRRRDVLAPRQLAMYLCRRYTDASADEIGRALGRAHTAVNHAAEKVERAMLEKAPLRYQVEALAAHLDRLAASRPR